MEAYRYEKLPGVEAGHIIRVLHLLPGKTEDPIEVKLEQVVLPNDKTTTAPNYEALSHVWGKPDDAGGRIHIRHGQTTRYLPVRQGLRSALVHLRDPQSRRILWIDAICVDQENSDETGSQVRRLGRVYRLARRVVIWLGEAQSHTHLAMDIIEFAATTPRFENPRPHRSFWGDQIGPKPRFDLRRLEEEEAEALLQLLMNPWFERVWVLQEVSLANRAEAVVQWGKRMIKLTVILDAATRLEMAIIFAGYRGTRLGEWKRRMNLLSHMRQKKLPTAPNLGTVMNWARGRECEDPRDHIYAVSSLCDEGASIVPDYSPENSTVDLFQKVTYDLVKKCSVLDLCEWPPTIEGLPSWVPDWTVGSRTGYMEPPWVELYIPNSFERSQSGSLLCWGIDFAEVEEVLPLNLDHGSSDADLDVQLAILLNRLFGTSSLTDEQLALVIRALTMDRIGDKCHGFKKSGATLHHYLEHMRSLFSTPSTPAYWRILTSMSLRNHLKGRAFVKVSTGSFGLAISSVQVGDRIFSVPGTVSPLALRPLGDGVYRVIGAASIGGYRIGEALLGPLKSQEWLSREGMGKPSWCFRDISKGGGWINRLPRRLGGGAVTWIDPRLKKFLGDMPIEDNRLEAAKAYNHLTPKVLQSHGVPIKQITLA